MNDGSQRILVVSDDDVCLAPLVAAVLRTELGDRAEVDVATAGTLAEAGGSVCAAAASRIPGGGALTGHRSRAVLMQNHGPFTIGKDARDAVKAAVMVEDVARTVHLARQGGPLIPIPQDAIDSLFDRYQNVYGQAPQGALQ